MSSVKSWIVGLTAGAAACGSVAYAAPVFVVDKQLQQVQEPMLPSASPAPGFSYVQSSASASTLDVYTEGFLFCGNPSSAPSNTAASLQIRHEDQSATSAVPWAFAKAVDVPQIVYNAGTLSVNPTAATTLTCLSSAVDGALVSGLRDGIFDSGYESATETNYGHAINWVPPASFNWDQTQPDWSQVPVDPCSPSEAQPARVNEDIACAAVTAVRPPAQTGGDPTRAGRIWTVSDGTTFTYLFQVDVRFGAQPPAGAIGFSDSTGDAGTDGNLNVFFTVVDAFDTAYLSTQPGTGEYCILTQLPTVLNSSVCSGSPVAQLNGQPLSFSASVDSATPYHRYFAIKRPIGGAPHSNLETPVVGVSILVEGAIVSAGGDKFSGDNIAFGFMPSSPKGFPWMRGGQ